MSTCTRRKLCTMETNGERCKYYHHPLLHDEGVFTGVAVVGNRNALLPVLSAELIGKRHKAQPGKILFDSGAQISIVRECVARSLKLQGRSITMTISKVGGITETVNTKLYDVAVRSNIDGKVQIIKAVGLEHIADEESNLCLEDISKNLMINQRELRRGSGSIDLLIGVDHPSLHMGTSRKIGDIVARKSEIGWVLFGGKRNSPGDPCRVLHISVATEVEMSRFWTTESMGVRAPSCNCVPDNLSPSERRVSQDMEKRMCEER